VSPEEARETLERGIDRCAETAREQSPTDPFGKLWFKLRGDGGDDLGGLVRDAVAELRGGRR
jgi:hypothetical protein